MTNNQQVKFEDFFQRLRLFAFFHLGSDARISLADQPEGIRVTIAHRRVTPFDFFLTWEELRALLDSPSECEDFLLAQLMRHRAS